MVTVAGTVAGAASSTAQVTSGGAAPSPTPVPTPALPVPPAPVIVVPTLTVSRTPAVVVATPVPGATATPTPRVTASPAAQVTPAATPSPTPSSTATAAATAEVAPTQPATPSPTPAPVVATAPASDDGGVTRYWPVALGAIVLALLALGRVLWRRRSADRLYAIEDAAAAEPLPQSAVAQGRLDITFRPIRAGLNLLSATSENEIVVTNIGDAVAENIHLHVALVSAYAGQDAEIAAFTSSPTGRPVVPSFTLQPGEQRTLTAVAALPREALRTLTAGGRPMFVPIVAVTLTYFSASDERRLAQAFAVGVERVDSPKLAPFWLDVPPRSFDQVAARPHAAAVES